MSTNMGGMGRQQARAQAQGGAPGQQGSAWLQLAPLLVLFAFSVLSQLPSLLSNTPADPDYSFSLNTKYTIPRTTSNINVQYFVNPKEYSQSKLYAAELDANPSLGFKPTAEPGTSAHRQELFQQILLPTAIDAAGVPTKLNTASVVRKFEKRVEDQWIQVLSSRCQVRRSVALYVVLC